MRAYDLVIVGGGFYGLRIAIHAREHLGLKRVAVLEREPEPMNRASYANQARVHNGYHYPRSILTAYRSRVNFPRFVDEYAPAVVGDFRHHYAIAQNLSKVSSRQFEVFCDRIGASWSPASKDVEELFDPRMIENLYEVHEPAFDSRILRQMVLDRARSVGGIDIHLGVEALSVMHASDGLEVVCADGNFIGQRVISTIYSRLNVFNSASGLPLVGLQHEVAEMALVEVPRHLRQLAFTVVDGPFFSLMPFPPSGLCTLSHVRYTPRHRWRDEPKSDVLDPDDVLRKLGTIAGAQWAPMIADVARFIPSAVDIVRRDSLIEVKTVLSRSDSDDSRPIFFSYGHGLAGYTCIMGGKLDNIYDALEELTSHYGQAG